MSGRCGTNTPRCRAVGTLVSSPLSDRIGRKKVIIYVSVVAVISLLCVLPIRETRALSLDH